MSTSPSIQESDTIEANYLQETCLPDPYTRATVEVAKQVRIPLRYPPCMQEIALLRWRLSALEVLARINNKPKLAFVEVCSACYIEVYFSQDLPGSYNLLGSRE